MAGRLHSVQRLSMTRPLHTGPWRRTRKPGLILPMSARILIQPAFSWKRVFCSPHILMVCCARSRSARVIACEQRQGGGRRIVRNPMRARCKGGAGRGSIWRSHLYVSDDGRVDGAHAGTRRQDARRHRAQLHGRGVVVVHPRQLRLIEDALALGGRVEGRLHAGSGEHGRE
jgi:hypothetical protein